MHIIFENFPFPCFRKFKNLHLHIENENRKSCLWKQRTLETKRKSDTCFFLVSSYTIVQFARLSKPLPHKHSLKRYLIFKVARMGLLVPKEIKKNNNLQYDRVRGDVLSPPHGTLHQQ